MNKGPEFRIVGGASEEKKEEARKELEQALFDHFASLSPKEKENLEKLEYPKSEKEIALINFANEETNRLRKKFGLEPYDIPKENYHIIPPEFYKEAASDKTTATTFYTKQGILFNVQHFRDNPVHFGAVALHETLHLKGHSAFEVEKDGEEVKTTPYRKGVTISALQKHGYHGKYHEHFDGLNEAIVVNQEKKSWQKILDLSALKKEKEWLMSGEAKDLRKKFAEKREIPEDDFVWVGKGGEDDWEIFSYRQQREVLDYMCIEIQKQFSEQFQTVDDVFNEFLKAHFTGRLLSIARMIEKTFGEGSFRLLGNMKDDKESGVLHLEALRKKRIKMIKK